MPSLPDEDLAAHLREVAVSGILFVMNLPNTSATRWMVEKVFGRLLFNLLDVAAAFDHQVGAEGMRAACAQITQFCGSKVAVSNAALLPKEGPLLLASNHPGYFDSFVLASLLPREDLKVLVGGVPYFNEMPNTREHIIYTDHSPQSSVQALRAVVRHLKDGGCALIFPTGLADPDPDVMSGAFERFAQWSESVPLLMRRVPELQLVTCAVSGILSPVYFNRLLARVQKKQRHRQRVAEFLQLRDQFKAVNVPPIACPRVTFGGPVMRAQLEQEAGGRDTLPAIIRRAQETLETHMGVGD